MSDGLNDSRQRGKEVVKHFRRSNTTIILYTCGFCDLHFYCLQGIEVTWCPYCGAREGDGVP